MVWQWTPVLVRKRGGKKSFLLLSCRMGKVSVAVPVKGVEGSKSAFPDSGISRCDAASFRW